MRVGLRNRCDSDRVFFCHATQGVEGVSVEIGGIKTVNVGDTFDLKVVIKNERAKAGLELADIDISEDYLGEFFVEAVSPKSKSSQHEPINDTLSHTFGVTIPAGETRTFVFTLRAERSGIFRGDVSVYEGLRSISATAQTSVRGEWKRAGAIAGAGLRRQETCAGKDIGKGRGERLPVFTRGFPTAADADGAASGAMPMARGRAKGRLFPSHMRSRWKLENRVCRVARPSAWFPRGASGA